MALNLDSILCADIAVGTKGVPLSAIGSPLSNVGERKVAVFDGEVSFPVAILKAGAMASNIALLQSYVDRARAKLAPHGKTTMCPQLFDRQLQAGAWGMTVANYAQASITLAYGVDRVLIANELAGAAEILAIAKVQAEQPDVLILSLVDSVAGIKRLEAALSANGKGQRLNVLVEVGISGRRCGARTFDDAMGLARLVADSDYLNLRGIEGYEGVIVTDDASQDAEDVSDFLSNMARTFDACRTENLFSDPYEIIVSAGGSAYFDLVARQFSIVEDEAVIPILRSGCYLTHDSGFYDSLLRHVEGREAFGAAPPLKPALEVWAQVLSRPEPDLVIIGAGRRDLSDDADMPVVQQWRRDKHGAKPDPVSDWTLFKMNDQHGYVSVAETSDIAVGDFIALGISHPCTTFDRWSVLLEVDDEYRILGAMKTFF